MTEPFKNGTLVVYTDGGCSGNPGPGGWACVIVDGEKEETISGGEKSTTNNRMELTAAIGALSAVVQNPQYGGRPVHIFCDSQYVKTGITSWIRSWKKNGWRTAAKKPVLNRDLWEKLDALSASRDISWSWVKGHAGIKYNELCDELCQKEIRRQKN